MEIIKLYEVVKYYEYEEELENVIVGYSRTMEGTKDIISHEADKELERTIEAAKDGIAVSKNTLEKFDKLKEAGFSELLDYFCNGGREAIEEKVMEISEKTGVCVEFKPEIIEEKYTGEKMYGHVNKDMITIDIDYQHWFYTTENDMHRDIEVMKGYIERKQNMLNRIKCDKLEYLRNQRGTYFETNEIEAIDFNGKICKLDEIEVE